MQNRLKSFFSRGRDATLAVVLVLAFFLIFMIILWFSFPKGTGLGTAIGTLTPPASPKPQPAVPGAPQTQWEQSIAQLASVKHNVKSKLASSIVWMPASEGLKLAERDAVQTQAQSAATIVFQKNQQITLGENSLVVIRRVDRDAATDAHRVSVVLLGGALEGSVAGVAGGGSVEILAGKASASIAAQGAGATNFRIAAATDDTSSITVTSGSANIQVGGRAVKVGPGQTVGIDAKGAIQGPRSIARPPALLTPENGAIFRTRLLPQDVAFTWKGEDRDKSFRVEVARDAAFHDTVIDEHVADARLAYPDLPAGRYYWRVRAVDKTAEGKVASPRAFEVARSSDPPKLDVTFPEGPLSHGPITVRGTTSPGARVFVLNLPVPVGPDGAFEGQVTLRAGAQVVVVEAIDSIGNTAYASRTLTAR